MRRAKLKGGASKDLIFGYFPFVPPSLVGAYYLHPTDARAIIFHNDLLRDDACFATGGGGVSQK